MTSKKELINVIGERLAYCEIMRDYYKIVEHDVSADIKEISYGQAALEILHIAAQLNVVKSVVEYAADIYPPSVGRRPADINELRRLKRYYCESRKGKDKADND